MKKPVDYDELFPNRFLKAGLFAARPLSLTIAAVDVEELPRDDGGTKIKGIVTFEKTDKQLVLNRTNAETIRAMFGRKLSDWIGKRITLASEKDRLMGKEVDAIRIIGSPDLDAAFVAAFDITKRIGEKMTVSHVRRPLGVTSPSNHGELVWIVPPPNPNDRGRHPVPGGAVRPAEPVEPVDDGTMFDPDMMGDDND